MSFTKNLFIIGFDPEFEDNLGLVDNPRNHALLQTKLSELGHPNAQIKFIKAERPSDYAETLAAPAVEPVPPVVPRPSVPVAQPAAKPKSAPAAASFNKDDFKNDPLIRERLWRNFLRAGLSMLEHDKRPMAAVGLAANSTRLNNQD